MSRNEHTGRSGLAGALWACAAALAEGETPTGRRALSPAARPRTLSRLAAGEDGLVSWATLFAVLFFLVLVALVNNVGIVVNQKIETQNGADATAHAGALWMARGMNGVTAANHLVGELMGLFVLHHALGAKWLDDHYADGRPNRTAEMELANYLLMIHYYVTKLFIDSPGTSASDYNVVKTTPVADRRSTIYQAKLVLKAEMIAAYAYHISGQAVALVPWTRAAGLAMMASARLLETWIAAQYRFLDAVEMMARALAPVKLGLPSLMQALYTYQGLTIAQLPGVARRAARELADRNGLVGLLAQEQLALGLLLPVEPETTRSESRSQLMRASYPWVHWWRKPILGWFNLGAPLSLARMFYMNWTNVYSREMCTAFRDSRRNRDGYGGLNLRLPVLWELDPPQVDKSQEMWARAEGTPLADRIFTVLGFARQRREPPVFARWFYRQANPDGVVAVAQALVYNANPQQAPRSWRGAGRPQPEVGWDTLNWIGDGAVEYPSTDYSPSRPPRVRLNWQAKLVPITQRKLAAVGLLPLEDDRIEYVFKKRLRPNNPLGKSLFTH